MNKAPILEIEPKELKFLFELMKQCSCSVQLTNNTYHHVAFKIKTTSPRKYSVRPNVGVLPPKSTCEFIVTMQAQKVAPEEMVCKDKFLIQSTLVPPETTSEDVTASLFVKDGMRYVEENKLKVALISPPDSPELAHVNGDSKNWRFDHEKVQIHCKDEIQSPEQAHVNGDSKNRRFDHEKVQIHSKDEIQSPEPMVLKNSEHNKVREVMLEEDIELMAEYDTGLDSIKDVSLKVSRDKELNTVKDVEELKPPKKIEFRVSKDPESIIIKNAAEVKPGKAGLKASKDPSLNTINNAEELKPEKQREIEVSKYPAIKAVKNIEELKTEKEAEVRVSKGIEELKLLEAIEEMKLKLDGLESKLNESGVTISKLTEERRLSNQETKILQEKLAELINKGPRKIQVGFPLLYVCMVALICVFLGYRLHS